MYLNDHSYTRILNQVHAGLWPVHNWFLEIAFIHDMCVCVCPQGHSHEWTLYDRVHEQVLFSVSLHT